MLNTVIDRLEDYDGKSFVLALGPNISVPDVPEDLFFHAVDPAPELIVLLFRKAIQRMAQGIVLVIDGADSIAREQQYYDSIKQICLLFFKHVYFPLKSPTGPDQFGIRKMDCIKTLSRLNSLRNILFALRYPLAQRLEGLNLKRPVLILMPGPSLSDMLPHLAHIQNKFLIICVSKSLPSALKAGVIPDFVIQQDTSIIQEQFYPAKDLDETYLVSLTTATTGLVGHQFRGMFFIESFDQEVLPSSYRLRESWVSTFIPCLGLAEALRASHVYLTGSDLSFVDSAQRYTGIDTRSETPESDRFDGVIFPHITDPFAVPNRVGNKVYTTANYLAAACEAEMVAIDMHRMYGTTFHIFSNKGLLRSDIFKHVTLDDLNHPDLDKAGVRTLVDTAMAAPEQIELIKLKMKLLKEKEQVEASKLMLDHFRLNGKEDDLKQHPVVEASQLYAQANRLFNYQDVTDVVEMSDHMLTFWKKLIERGVAIAELHRTAKRGKKAPAICLEGEELASFGKIISLFPGLQAEQWMIWPQDSPVPDDGRNWIGYRDLGLWLKKTPAAFISPAADAKFSYELSIIGRKKLFVMDTRI